MFPQASCCLCDLRWKGLKGTWMLLIGGICVLVLVFSGNNSSVNISSEMLGVQRYIASAEAGRGVCVWCGYLSKGQDLTFHMARV